MKSKKGISAVVATVLIILITVAAVTIIWAAIIPMINNQLDKGTLCLDAVSQVTLLDAGYTCKNDGANISIQVKHGAKDFKIADVQVLVSAGGSTTTFDLSNTTTTLDPTTATFAGSNEETVYVIAANATYGVTETIEKVEIAPVVAVGNTQETCDISASKVLTDC